MRSLLSDQAWVVLKSSLRNRLNVSGKNGPAAFLRSQLLAVLEWCVGEAWFSLPVVLVSRAGAQHPAELHSAWEPTRVSPVWCARGGGVSPSSQTSP